MSDTVADHKQITRIVITDERVIMQGHSWNKAACVALSASVQTFTRVAGALGLLAEPVEQNAETGFVDVRLVPALPARAALTGLVAAFHGIATQCPGTIEVADQRREGPTVAQLVPTDAPPDDDGRANGAFAASGQQPRLSIVGNPERKIVLPGLPGGQKIVRAG